MNILFAFGGLGGWEWVVVILAVLLLFGAKKIPELARGLGTGIKEFKKATREVTDEIQNATENHHSASQKNSKSEASGQSPPPETVSQSSAPPKS